jgi:diguanylate cyclase (GGDEF)-like protein/PAS domain S-box-containing protein
MDEELFRGLLDTAPEAIVVVDEAGDIMLVNSQAERLFGYRRDELAGRKVEMLMPQRYRERHAGHRDGFFTSPATRPMGAGLELYARCRDGRELPVEISLSPLVTDRGTLVSAAIRDVTERLAGEEARRLLAAVVEHTDDAIYSKDPDGTITSWNKGAERLYGYSASEAIGMSVGELVPADRHGEEEQILEHLVTGGWVERSETVRVRKDGSRVEVSLTVSPIRDVRGAVIAASTITQDITERKRVEGQLQYLADHDSLTGLFNRRRFAEELARELARARRRGSDGALLVIDLDYFKYVNDTLGHNTGDELIKQASGILHRRLRNTDVMARAGGDEFTVLLPDVNTASARRVASDLLEAIRSEGRVTAQQGPRGVTASIGIAVFEGDGDLTAEDLLVEGDIAMYDAKEAGRDRAVLYSPSQDRHERMRAGLTWAERIRDALRNDKLVLHAQSILPLNGDVRPRHELLVRLIGEGGDLIPPGVFLYIADRFDLIQQIDRWVLRDAIRLLAREQKAGHDIQLGINVSAKTIIDRSLPEYIAHELQEAGAEGHGLWLEVTEMTAIINLVRAVGFARAVGELGCEVALDDFGAGFASFYYLKHLAFDYLKIDGEFIQDLPRSQTNQLIVRSIVDIARGLGKHTIAEFVGDATTITLLRQYGVDFGQGFYVAQPKPLGDLDLAVVPSEEEVH